MAGGRGKEGRGTERFRGTGVVSNGRVGKKGGKKQGTVTQLILGKIEAFCLPGEYLGNHQAVLK